jgi:hypothetical protein
MGMRLNYLALIAPLAVALSFGCKKKAPTSTVAAAPPAPSAGPAETVARIHWLGQSRLSAETNAAGFMRIWSLTESTNLEAQTLDKLSVAPWRLLPHVASTNADGAGLLRPLLDDCVRRESYVEIRQATNQAGELAFAIRLDRERAGLWETNLAAVLESLTGIHPASSPGGRRGWSLRKHHAPNLIELVRAGEWTVVGLGQEHNILLDDVLARIARNRAPFTARATNFWLEADVDPRRAVEVLSLGWHLPEGLPRVSLAAIGDGENVRTWGELNFPDALPSALESWNIPTNLIRGPLAGVTAIRGIGPWLASLKGWNDLQIGAPPDQVCVWALLSSPMHMYFAAPLPDASNKVSRLTDYVLQKGGPWFATNRMVKFEKSRTFDGLVWKGLPFVSPFLRSIETGEGDFVFGGLFPSGGTNRLPSPVLLREVCGRTNLVCYQWEITGQRVVQCIYLGQFLRFASLKAQLAPHSASLAWLRIAAPVLGHTRTEVTRRGPGQLSFARQSTVGFTGAELQLLADWLDSPQFPRGLYSLQAPPPPGLRRPGKSPPSSLDKH